MQMSMLTQERSSMKSTLQQDSQLTVLPSAAGGCELRQMRPLSRLTSYVQVSAHILCMCSVTQLESDSCCVKVNTNNGCRMYKAENDMVGAGKWSVILK